jgi:hypothetical protein
VTKLGIPGYFGYYVSAAYGINNVGQVVGLIVGAPEPSTWTVLLVGFAGLGFVGYRRARAGRTLAAWRRGRDRRR